MGNFISNLVARHTSGGNYVMPRLRGRFEPQGIPAQDAAPACLPGETPAEPAHPAQPLQAAAQQQQEHPSPAAVSAQHQLPRYQAPALFRAAPEQPPETAHAAPLQPLLRQAASPQPWPRDTVSPLAMQPSISTTGTVNNTNNPHEERERTSPVTPPGQEQHTRRRSVYFSPVPTQTGKDGPAFSDPGLQLPATLLPPALPSLSGWDRSAQGAGPHATATADATPRPVVRVTIGRIDVRATQQPAATKTSTAAKPAMSLDDFLKKRSGGTS